MRKRVVLGVIAALALVACDRGPRAAQTVAAPTSRPAADPQDCVAGCDAADDSPAHLEPAAFDALVEGFAEEAPAAGSLALEKLLFHHGDARRLLEQRGPGPLDPERAAFLRRELAREHAWIDLRVIDARGVERVRLGRRAVPLGEKQHMHDVERLEGLQPLEVSGTVRRVGLYHLWSRI